jgi:hypothetical protein
MRITKRSCSPGESDYPAVKYVEKHKNKNYALYKGIV